MIDTCSEKKKSSYSTNTKKTIISLQNFQAPLTFSLYLALSNLISKINIYSSILSLSLSNTPKLPSTRNYCFYFLVAALLSSTSGFDHLKSPPPLPMLITSKYSLFIGNSLLEHSHQSLLAFLSIFVLEPTFLFYRITSQKDSHQITYYTHYFI